MDVPDLLQGTLAITDTHAWLMEGTEDGITLAIKPNGITCTLSKFLPQYIAKNLSFFADGFLTKNNLTRADGEGRVELSLEWCALFLFSCCSIGVIGGTL